MSRRLFLALWPEPDVRRQISTCQQKLKLQSVSVRCAQPVKAENLHLTLRFLGTVAESRIDALCARLATIAQPGFELSVQGLGYFAASRALWLGLKSEPPELLELVESTARAVVEVLPELTSGAEHFIAHMSLCNNVAVLPEAEACAVIHWPVTEFALVESINTIEGVAYRVLQRWPLISPAP